MPKGLYERTEAAKAASRENLAKARAAQTPTWARARGEANRRRRDDPAVRAEAAAVAAENWAAWRAANPEKAAAANHQSGLISTAVLWQCESCLRVIAGPAIGMHQKRSGHSGRTRIGNKESESA